MLAKKMSYIAVGLEKSMPNVDCSKSHTCILCQEDNDDINSSSSGNTLVFATYVVKSTVLSQIHPVDPNLANKSVSHGILPRHLKCGPTVTSCGHVMHAKCYQTMFDNLVKQHRQVCLHFLFTFILSLFTLLSVFTF